MKPRRFFLSLSFWLVMTMSPAWAESFPNRPTTVEMDEKARLGTECIKGINERSLAIYQVPLFARTDPALGWYLDRLALGQMAPELKRLVPNFVDQAPVHDPTPYIERLSVSNVWKTSGIGNKSNEFTAMPARGAQVATYGDFPPWVYVTNLQERYKVAWTQQQTMSAVIAPKPRIQQWSGMGRGLTAEEAYNAAVADYSDATTVTVSGNLSPNAAGIYYPTAYNSWLRDDGEFRITYSAPNVYWLENFGDIENYSWWEHVGMVDGTYQPMDNAAGVATVVYTPVPVEQYCRTAYWSDATYPDGTTREALIGLTLRLTLTNNLLAGDYVTNNVGDSADQIEEGRDWADITNVFLNDGQASTISFPGDDLAVAAYGGSLDPDVGGIYRWAANDMWLRDDSTWIAGAPYDYRLQNANYDPSIWQNYSWSAEGIYSPVIHATGEAMAASLGDGPLTSKWLHVSGFGFNIPPGVMVTNIIVELSAAYDNTPPAAGYICLTTANSATNLISFEGYQKFEGLWGITNLGSDDINNPAFGCNIRVERHQGFQSLYSAGLIDYVVITVQYRVPNDWPDPSGSYVASAPNWWWTPDNEPDCVDSAPPGDWSAPALWVGQGQAAGWYVFELQANAYIARSQDITCGDGLVWWYCKPNWRKQHWDQGGPAGVYSEVLGPPGLTGTVTAVYEPECGEVQNLATNTYNGASAFYQVWLNKVVCVNDSFVSSNIEHKTDYWYKPHRPSSSSVSVSLGASNYYLTGNSFYSDQSLGMAEDMWNLEGWGEWGPFTNMPRHFGGNASEPPAAAPVPTVPQTFNISGFVVGNEAALTLWDFQYTVDKFWE